jgi:hypothetical protein
VADPRNEIRLTVIEMLHEMQPLASKAPDAPARGGPGRFNTILLAAKAHYPESIVIQGLKSLQDNTNLADLVGALAALKGAITSNFDFPEVEQRNPLIDGR